MAASLRQARAKIENIHKHSHFSKREVEELLKIYASLTKPNEKLDRVNFRDVLFNYFNMTDDILMDKVFRTFDDDNDGIVSQEEWIVGLSIVLRGSIEEQAKYCFSVYDANGDGHISREEVFHMLKNSLIRQPTEEDPDEGIKDLVELAMKKMDMDHDNRLSLQDFKQAVAQENLLLEAFGPCLPSPKAAEAFLATFADEYAV